jgi:hypothetical protein
VNWRSTEFLQQAFVQLSGAVGLYTGHVSDESYVALSALALGIYTAGRTVQKRDSRRYSRDDDHGPRLEDW